MLTRVAYRKTSLVDFPGRVATVVFLPGCDFRCPYCHNAPLVDSSAGGDARNAGDAALVTLDDFIAFVEKRKRLVSGVAISGGEPLIHEETLRLAADLRGRGLAVKLDTNGSLPDRLATLVGENGRPPAVDYVALDLKTAPSAYDRVAPGMPDAAGHVLESLRLLRAARAGGVVDFELRITCAPGIVGPDEAEELSGLLEPADRVFLQAFRPGGCLDPAWDSVEPYPDSAMAGFLETLRRRAPLASIRGR